ncbi:MAG: (Fe-S)-binding protein [Bacteroidetes bacterium]|nr:(Fe-S)-binding protein [Bacteroidota bacterium]
MEPTVTIKTFSPKSFDPLRACVHCGLCLEDCPTYKLTGDENNSPRGRLLLWRSENEGLNPPNVWTDFYTDECIGCLACESACPANVPYARLLEEKRRVHYQQKRTNVKWQILLAGKAVLYPRLFNLMMMPIRALRRLDIPFHRLVFSGKPPLTQSSYTYAKELMRKHKPTGPTISLLTGCMTEAVFREINFATIRVLINHNIQIIVPEGQACCGAFHEHAGLPQAEYLKISNRQSFSGLKTQCALTNSAGCGLSLSNTLKDTIGVEDVLVFLSKHGINRIKDRPINTKLYVDLPCHLVHGQRSTIPEDILDATGYSWEYAPNAKDCCGSGGIYNINKPANAKQILMTKVAFIEDLPPEINPIIATSNHVCMMQWNQAKRLIKRHFEVRHVIQLLD